LDFYEPMPAQMMPNDPEFGKLWGMHSASNAGDIDAPEAWDMYTGSGGSNIIVAVIDTGIDYNHEDLQNRMWVNPGEIPNNGIDDDGNGWIDDVHGIDLVGNDGDPMDDNSHGTHCAGTVAAAGNNGVGVAGVALQGVRLMAIKFLSASGSGSTSDVAIALDYAVAHGAKITSNSYGGGGSSSVIRAAIQRAEEAGILFFAAAGNAGTDNDINPHYPANYDVPNVVSVAASQENGNLASFTCFGENTVHVAAPGSGIYSTEPSQSYGYKSGTSMAAPMVSGLAALIWLYRPALTHTEVRLVIESTVVVKPSHAGKSTTSGIINAKNALTTASTYAPPNPPIHAPVSLTFSDSDVQIGILSGVVSITPPAVHTDVDYFKVYFISTTGEVLSTVGNLSYRAPNFGLQLQVSSLVVPTGAEHMVAVSGNPLKALRRIPKVQKTV